MQSNIIVSREGYKLLAISQFLTAIKDPSGGELVLFVIRVNFTDFSIQLPMLKTSGCLTKEIGNSLVKLSFSRFTFVFNNEETNFHKSLYMYVF